MMEEAKGLDKPKKIKVILTITSKNYHLWERFLLIPFKKQELLGMIRISIQKSITQLMLRQLVDGVKLLKITLHI